MRNNVLEVSNLSKSFGSKRIIHDVSFFVRKGDVFGFLGPNGAGKTTIIRMMLGLIHPDAGTVMINGYDLKKDFTRAIAGVGAIVETPSFYPYLTGEQNLRLIANLHPELSKNRVGEVLEMVGLAGKTREKVKTYSLGMRQRLGIACALVNRPRLVFLDEPTNGLDPQGMKEVREMISQLTVEQDITFFVTTHQLHEVEQICNRVGILKEGCLIAQSEVRELLRSDHETVEVCAAEAGKAVRILRGIDYVRSVRPSTRGLYVELERGCSARLNGTLVAGNIAVSYLRPVQRSLEELFIELTEGGKQIA